MGSVDTAIKQMDVWIPTPPALGNWSFLVFFCQKLVSWVQIAKHLVTLLRR